MQKKYLLTSILLATAASAIVVVNNPGHASSKRDLPTPGECRYGHIQPGKQPQPRSDEWYRDRTVTKGANHSGNSGAGKK